MGAFFFAGVLAAGLYRFRAKLGLSKKDAPMDTARPQHARLFGRRKGRPLNAHKTELMETLLPRIAVSMPDAGGAIDLSALFGGAVPDAVWLEVGFGAGEHLLQQAQKNPSVGLIGCEPFINGVASLLSAIERLGVKNIRIHAHDARDVLDALPPGSLARVFVQYPDPWPKKRHAERRFIGRENLDRLARALKPGGELRLATDVAALAQWMRAQSQAHEAFEAVYDGPTAPHDWIPTRYEIKGIAAGRAPTYLIFRRK